MAYCVLLFLSLTVILTGATVVTGQLVSKETALFKYIVFVLTNGFIIYNYKVFEESFAKKLFTMQSAWLISIIFILTSVYALERIMSLNPEAYNDFKAATLRLSLEMAVRLLQLFSFIAVRKIYKHFIRFIDDRTVYFMSLYTFIGILFSYENFRNDASAYVNINLRNLLFFVGLIAVGYIVACIAIVSKNRTSMLNGDIKIIEGQLSHQRENYRSLIDFMEERSKLKHDLRHHIMAVKSMLESGKAENALQYIRQFDQGGIMRDIPMLCENMAADSLIKYYMGLASNKGIKFETRLNIPEEINVNSADLSVILGNCVENAINASERLVDGESRFIELKSDIVGRQLIIIIRNSFCGIIKRDGEAYISSSHDGYGIGIASVEATVKKYSGNMDIKYTADEFEVNIVLPA